jgi:hypothetical protein
MYLEGHFANKCRSGILLFILTLLTNISYSESMYLVRIKKKNSGMKRYFICKASIFSKREKEDSTMILEDYLIKYYNATFLVPYPISSGLELYGCCVYQDVQKAYTDVSNKSIDTILLNKYDVLNKKNNPDSLLRFATPFTIIRNQIPYEITISEIISDVCYCQIYGYTLNQTKQVKYIALLKSLAKTFPIKKKQKIRFEKNFYRKNDTEKSCNVISE